MVFQDNVEPNDIKQGLLGDCYFLSALSVLSEQSELVMRLFHTRECTPQGIFCVWLNAHGEWQSIVIDDQFPCSDLNSPAFSRAHGEELWVMIMEKAYAKMYGTYERIEGGNPAMALRDLTGAPYENMDEGTAEELWDFVW
jgi:calpain-15